MAAAVQSEKSSGAAAESCTAGINSCSDPEAPAAAPRKQDSLMPEIREDEDSTSSSNLKQADQLADDIRHTLSTSKQHIIQARPAEGGSIDSDRK